MKDKKYYIGIDYIRVIACIAIFLYHLGLLKGGYLAVCMFFVLSGYLAWKSAFSEKYFSVKSYFGKKLKKVYIPLLLFVFVTIAVVSLIPNVHWVNLRPETISILFGYNNFWQLHANLDYFTKQLNSPFIHLWYISILFQFYLIFPFIYIGLRKIGKKIKKSIPLFISLALAIIFGVYFYVASKNQDMMSVYYGTFSRLFSLFFGLALGVIHSYYKPLLKDKKALLYKIIFGICILILLVLFIFIDSNSPYFAISMIVVSLITCLLINVVILINKKLNVFDKIVKSLANISYEIYLIQYPVIYLFQYVYINNILKVIIIVIITLVLSYLLNFSLKFDKERKNIFKVILLVIFIIISMFGFYKFEKAREYIKQMQQLEELLNKNEKTMEEKQKEYEQKVKDQHEEYVMNIGEIDEILNNLDLTVSNLSVVGIGDSVMLGAVNNLYDQFPNGYFDAKVSRAMKTAIDILNDLNNKNMLGDVIVLNLGANGDCSSSCKDEIIKSAGDRDIFWVNVTNDENVHVNQKLQDLSIKYENVHVIDWNKISEGHDEYFYADGIHLTIPGRKAYTKVIYDAIYQLYLEKYNNKKEEITNNYVNNKINFYSDDILVNALDEIEDSVPNVQFVLDNDFDFDKIYNLLSEAIKNNNLGNKVVLSFETINLSLKDYQKLIELCQDRQVYIVVTKESTMNKLGDLNNENVEIINFYEQIKDNKNYLILDGLHLSDKGSSALSKILIEVLK